MGKGKVKFEQTEGGLKINIPKGFLPDNGFVIKVIS